jgi:hypothetical protein
VRERRRAEFLPDAAGPPGVGQANAAAGRAHKFGVLGDRRDAAQLGDHGVALQRDDLLRGRHGRARETEQR